MVSSTREYDVALGMKLRLEQNCPAILVDFESRNPGQAKDGWTLRSVS